VTPASITTRVGVYVGSITGVGLGVALMVSAHLGAAPNDVMNTGVARVLDTGVGTASWVTSGIAMLLAWTLGRRPRIATVLGGVIVGLSINLFMKLLPEPHPMAPRILMLTLGLLVVWSGITGVVSADVGAGPLELVMLAIMDRGVRISVARWGIELTLLAIGLALGGAAGVGTAIFAFATGPVLAYTLPRAAALLGTSLSQPVDVAATGTT
jgi:uncharacterized membrane protein YczE